MILRRITQAFRKQDWFTVFVETMIVVFGVFIGLQVNNWNEARSADRIEAELRTALEQDFVELETQLSDRIQSLNTLAGCVSKLLDIVRTDVPPTDSEAIIALLNKTSNIPRLPSPPVSYVEASSAGRLSTLSDPELRRALSRYGQAVELYQFALPMFSDPIVGRSSLFAQAIRISSDLEVTKDPDGGIEGYDWEILKNADYDVQMALLWAVSGEQLALRQLNEVETILELLGSERAR
ncbi:DUF6090 family protein [Hyphococcus sp.]|uniref:DUF6090 family protein n=1 Tax=Hyphococcus sp. TaxID=2038636 RepID=UPI002088434E|nr:MAG: hypothetical protein DHS20C04_10110 [Marinicaulis sp.]